MVFAFDVALDILLKKGMDNVIAHHARIGKAARAGMKSLGLTLLADESYASDTVTAVLPPSNVDIRELRRILREENQIVIGGGQGKLDGKIFRIGHMGYVTEPEIAEVTAAVGAALRRFGPSVAK
jgi:aspartate aminotransferase-like enzyme